MKVEEVKMPDGRVVDHRIISGSFEEWITHVFDHPSEERGWWWNDNTGYWDAAAADTVAFLTRTFEESASVLKPFTDSQVANGLDYIYNPSCSDIAFVLLNESVPWPARKHGIRSLQKLYADCFAVRCSSLLCHLEKTSGPPLNGVCYMWWDVFPINGKPEDAARAELDKECLAVMEFALGLESVACRESALHGLGHWAPEYPDFVHRVIDRFIETNPSERPELLTYANNAREGGVL